MVYGGFRPRSLLSRPGPAQPRLPTSFAVLPWIPTMFTHRISMVRMPWERWGLELLSVLPSKRCRRIETSLLRLFIINPDHREWAIRLTRLVLSHGKLGTQKKYRMGDGY